MDLIQAIDAAERAARIGGKILLDWSTRFTVREKGKRDLVTQADVESEQAIRDFLGSLFPDHGFLGEECGHIEGEDPEHCWVVDPLDGTTNYVHQLPSYSVSVALRQRNEIVAGVVYDPLLDECFASRKGNGASLNNKPIRVSSIDQLEQALLVVSLPAAIREESDEYRKFTKLLLGCQGFRRLGSAALNLCYVAMGRLDIYWAESLSLWDAAAGLRILEEAGGDCRHVSGSAVRLDDPRFVAAANESLTQDVLELLSQD